MLFALVVFFSLASIEAQKPASKPDLQKVYSEALTWSKTKLEVMPKPDAQGFEPVTQVCRGAKNPEALQIASSCKKHKAQELDEVLEQVTTQEQDVHDTRDKILVFVSFSMPKPSLVALSKEAEKHGAVLLMRGLKDDSFKKTQIAFQELGKDLQSGIEINPEAFETYKIIQVPVFVRVKSFHKNGAKEVGRIAGNVSLAFAAKKLKEIS